MFQTKKEGIQNISMPELGRICVNIGLKWVINSISQSFNSLIKWKLIPLYIESWTIA